MRHFCYCHNKSVAYIDTKVSRKYRQKCRINKKMSRTYTH